MNDERMQTLVTMFEEEFASRGVNTLDTETIRGLAESIPAYRPVMNVGGLDGLDITPEDLEQDYYLQMVKDKVGVYLHEYGYIGSAKWSKPHIALLISILLLLVTLPIGALQLFSPTGIWFVGLVPIILNLALVIWQLFRFLRQKQIK